MFTVEPHTSCGKSENEESHTECVVDQSGLAVAKPEMSTGDFVAMRLSCSENCFEVGRYEAARLHVEAARERLELDADIPAEQKAKLLTALKQREDQLFAFEVGEQMVDGLPTRKVRELALTLCRASPENLSMFRERVVAGAFLSNREGVLALIGG